ncbi:RfbB dTDP-D-glucose 4,6-dehydratase [Candidatus Planktophila dulcis]|uniref:dTDP-glucose 4,6-dehydratase n=1 Tax=Candidatus Planktophila dulcis TaxID=1884914 RepID=UPI003BEEE889
MKYFVTGGAGFIGSNYVNLLLSETEDVESVTVFDNFTYAANPKNLEKHISDPRLRIVRGNICDPESVGKELRCHNTVVHFAAESHVDRSIEDSSVFVRTNVLGTYVLLEAARQNNIETFMHVSTDEVYGSLEIESATEEFPLRPNSPYAASKAASDLLARSYFVTHGLDVRITRCCNNYGPNQYPEKVIPVLTRAGLNLQKLPIYGNGKNIREWIYVRDHCRGIQIALEHGSPGEIYNIGTGLHLSNLDLASKVISALNLPTDSVQFVEDRKGHDFRYSVDSSKINALGFSEETDFENGLTSTIDWYRGNQDWWE